MLLPDHELRVTPRGQVEGRELYQVIRETPRGKGSAGELDRFVRDLMARNQPLVRIVQHPAAATQARRRRPATVLVQDNLTPGPDAETLLADGHVVALVALSGRGGDAERPRSGNWMNNTRAWLVGRNLQAMHAAEINAAVAEAGTPRGRGSGAHHRARVRRRGRRIAAGRSGESANRIRVARPHAPQRARGHRRPIHTNLHDAVIPGFALKWDLADLRELMRPRSVIWKDPTDWMGNVVALEGPLHLHTPAIRM